MSDLEPKQYSERLGMITPEQIQRALDRFDAGTLEAAEPAPGGLFGQNIMLETTAGRWVLRGAPHHDAQFAQERYFAELINKRSRVPAPAPYHIEDSPEIFGWPFALMPRLEGDALTAEGLREMEPPDRVAAARAYGRGLAALQQASWPEHAWYDIPAGELRPLGKPYAQWYGEWTEHWLDLCTKASDATTADDVAWVRTIVAAGTNALAAPMQPVLVHTDYAQGNVLLVRQQSRWQISGILDLADCYMGDGEADLPRMYRALQRIDRDCGAAFAEAYASARPPRPGVAQRWRHHVLRDLLVFWEYGQRNSVWFKPGMTLRDFAERFVEAPCPI